MCENILITTNMEIIFFVRKYCLCLCTLCTFSFGVCYLLQQMYEDEETLFLAKAKDVINPWASNIIFVTTKKLTPIQTCSIESAAKANPLKRIYVLFNSNIMNSSELNVLRNYDNIALTRINPIRLVLNDSLGRLIRTNEKIRGNVEVLKILAMLNYGGIYLDLDVLTIKPLDGLLDNFVVRSGVNQFTLRAIGISISYVGKRFMDHLASQLQIKFKNNDISDQQFGERILTEALKIHCKTSYPKEMSAENCPGLQVYDNAYFAMKDDDVINYLVPTFLQRFKNKHIKTVSLRGSYRTSIMLEKHFPSLASKYCPSMFENASPGALKF